MHELSSANLVWLIPMLPLVGFLLNAFVGKKLGKPASGGLATLAVFASFAVATLVFMGMMGLEGEHRRQLASLLPGGSEVPWISIGNFTVTYTALIDPLSMLMCLIITGVGGLIHLYSMGYMADEKDYSRFFTYLNLFIFFMLVLVLGGNFLLMFVGWEGVGLCSYLLISFWFEDIENSKAGNKAFIVNRIGDVGFALGIMAVFATFKTLTFYSADGKGFLDMARSGIVAGGAPLTVGIATTIALLLFVGACGKSAQFPLYVWLPDAMAGPTPVSALIHAATMVTAGVVMITRVSPIVVQAPLAMTVIATVGIFTAFFAATIALTQTDIKKVLAYSTVSQLGYMFLGCGVGAFSAGMFHVMTHAFFKALLFLGAGSVIHAMHHEQDMRKMGGLASKIPVTFWTMVAGWLAISGIAPFAGFWSKDEILGAASGYERYGVIFYAVGLITALMTAFYMTRMMWKTFLTNARYNEAELGMHHAHVAADDVAHGSHDGALAEDSAHGAHGASEARQPAGVHESPSSMLLPLAILAVLSAVGGLVGMPWNNKFEAYLEPSVAKAGAVHELFPTAMGLGIGLAVGALGIFWAATTYRKRAETGELLSPEQKAHNPLYQGSVNLWGFDWLTTFLGVRVGGMFARLCAWFDRTFVDGIVNLSAGLTGFFSETFRRGQTGFVRSYALVMLVGVVAVVISLLWPIVGH